MVKDDLRWIFLVYRAKISRPETRDIGQRYQGGFFMDAARRELLEKFRTGPGKLERSIDGLSENELEFSSAPGKWSIREIVIHLCDSEIVGAERIRKVLG